MRKLVLPLLALLSVSATTCSHIPTDSSAQAAQSGDDTIQLQGLGAASQRGYLFVEKTLGTDAVDAMALIVPGVDCSEASCVRFQFFRKDGTPGMGGGIPKGQTLFGFKLSDLLGHPGPVAQSDDGEYSGSVQVLFKGADGLEHQAFYNGFVRLLVLQPGYSPVGCGDPAVAWHVSAAKNCDVQFTTAGRSMACGKGCAP